MHGTQKPDEGKSTVSKLRRWSEDDPPPQVRRLLEVGQWERPSRAVFEQARSLMQAAGTAGVLDAGDIQLPAGRGNTARSAVKWTLIGTLIVGAIGALTLTLGSEQSASSPTQPSLGALANPAPPKTTAPPRLEPPRPSEAPVVASPPTSLDPSARGQAEAPKRTNIALPAPSERSPAATSEHASRASVCKPRVVEQIQMLEQAKNAIRAGRAGAALGILNRYDAYGKGRCFVPESLKHRMDAQLQLGDRAAARRTASAIKARYPDTAQARAAEVVLTK